MGAPPQGRAPQNLLQTVPISSIPKFAVPNIQDNTTQSIGMGRQAAPMNQWDHRAFGDGHIVQLACNGCALAGIGCCGQLRMQGVIFR